MLELVGVPGDIPSNKVPAIVYLARIYVLEICWPLLKSRNHIILDAFVLSITILHSLAIVSPHTKITFTVLSVLYLFMGWVFKLKPDIIVCNEIYIMIMLLTLAAEENIGCMPYIIAWGQNRLRSCFFLITGIVITLIKY